MNYPTLQTCRQYESDGWLRSSEHPELPLTIFTYSHAAQYENHWDEVTKVARGIVFSDDGELVQVPIQKMFNFGDPNAPSWANRPFTAFEKMDGSLILVTMWKGHKLVTTKGSFTSPQALDAPRFLKGWEPPEGHTVFFEYIVPENRIVLDYGDFEGLILLGAVRHEDGFDAFNPYQIQVDTGWHGEVVNVHTFHFNHMTNTIANPENGEGREGFVVVIQNESGPADRIKMKFAKYVQLHSLMSGLTNKRVWQLMRDGTMDDYIGQFPDEMHKAIQGYAMELVRELTRIMSESGLIHDEVRLLPTRREQAEFINKNVENREYRPLVFAFLDGDLDKVRSIAYKIMEPDQSIPLMQQ